MPKFVVEYNRAGHDKPCFDRRVTTPDTVPNGNLRAKCAYVLGCAWGSDEIREQANPYWTIRNEELIEDGARFELYFRGRAPAMESHFIRIEGDLGFSGPW